VAPAFRIMGIVNVTPDSFSDGGEWFERDAAIAHARTLADEGAAILDVGGESTRPFADPVPADEELRRVLPVVEALAGPGVQVSVDTMKLEVARVRVLRRDGEPVGFGRACVREVTKVVFGYTGILWLIDVLWPLGQAENKALHDLIAGTRVVAA